MTQDNRLSGPTVEEFAQKYNTEIIVLSSPRGEYHNAVIAVHGAAIHLTRLHSTVTDAREDALRVAQQAWRNQKGKELEAAQAETSHIKVFEDGLPSSKLPRKGRGR